MNKEKASRWRNWHFSRPHKRGANKRGANSIPADGDKRKTIVTVNNYDSFSYTKHSNCDNKMVYQSQLCKDYTILSKKN